MAIPNFTRVRVTSDRFKDEGISKGDIGYIIEVYDGIYYEVEFSGPDGVDYAQTVIPEADLEIAEEM
jgi:hypothetical protein